MGHHPSEAYDPSRFGTGKKTITSYIIGLVLSLIFTGIAFWVTANHVHFNIAYVYIALTVLALSQLIAQVVCFLRLNNTESGRWNLMPFLFTLIVAVVLIGGSLWIMYNLNYNMVH